MDKEEMKEKLLCALKNNVKDLHPYCNRCDYRLLKGDIEINLEKNYTPVSNGRKVLVKIKPKYLWHKKIKKETEIRENVNTIFYSLKFNSIKYEISKAEYDSVVDARNQYLEVEEFIRESFQLSQLNKLCNGE